MKFNADTVLIFIRLAINLILTGAALAIGVGIVFRLTRNSSPRLRYLIAVLVFCFAAFYPVWMTFNFSGRQPETIIDAAGFSAVNNENLLLSAETPVKAVDFENQPDIEEAPGLSNKLSEGFQAVVESIIQTGAGAAFLFLWLSISLCLIGRDLVGHFRLMKARQKWKTASPELCRELEWGNSIPLLLDAQKGPGTIGFFRPAVVIPAELLSIVTLESARYVLRHELSHAVWRDPLAQAIVRLIRAAFWISPALWFLENIIRAEREVAADRAAINSVRVSSENNEAAIEYADSLVQIAYQLNSGAPQSQYDLIGTHFGRKDGIEMRLKRLFMPISQPGYIFLLPVFFVIIGSIFGASSLSFAIVPKSLAIVPNKTGEPFLGAENQTKDSENYDRSSEANPENRLKQKQSNDFLNTGNLQTAQSLQTKPSVPENKGNEPLRTETQLSEIQPVIKTRISETSTAAVPVLLPAENNSSAENNNEKVKVASVQKPAESGNDSSIESLITALGDSNPTVRQAAAAVLKNKRDGGKAVPQLIRALKDSSANVRQQAAAALGAIGDRRATSALINSLKDGNSYVRQTSSEALGNIGDDQAVAPLEELSADGNRFVRQSAENSLKKLNKKR